MNSHFFQSFFGSQNVQNEQIKPEYIIHNETILEIINNWSFIIDLFEKYKNKNLKTVDSLEQKWIYFIINNNIDITKYKDEQVFKNEFWKNP